MGTISSNNEERNNCGPASMSWVAKEHENEIVVEFGIMMAGDQVEKNPLNITDAVDYYCTIDENEACVISDNGEVLRKVEYKKMKKTAEDRKKSERDVETLDCTVAEFRMRLLKNASRTEEAR